MTKKYIAVSTASGTYFYPLPLNRGLARGRGGGGGSHLGTRGPVVHVSMATLKVEKIVFFKLACFIQAKFQSTPQKTKNHQIS